MRLFTKRPAIVLFILMAFYSCKKETIINDTSTEENLVASGYFTRFWFDTAQNPLYLNDTISLSINGTAITGRIPYYSNLSGLIPSFEFSGDSVTVNDSIQLSGVTRRNFKAPVTYNVVSGDGNKTTYTVNLLNFTGLPVLKIKTTDGVAITSNVDYVSGTVSIDGAGQFDDLSDATMQIRGHGNSTWGLAKNPYRIKFSSKTAVLGQPKAKNWILLANYLDKTMLRNSVSLYLGKLSNLDWTPTGNFAEVFLNEVYIGTYLITEKIEQGSGRVNVGDNGFVIEVDQPSRVTEDDRYFQTSRILCNIKDPEVEIGDDQYTYIRDYVTNAEGALYADNFTDTTEGYARYLDVNSFVDWYLVNEITKNNDAVFFSSCYMNLIPGGKLKMGPIWDFDISLGNINYNSNQDYTGFWVKSSLWIARLFEDPAFVAKVQERFKYFKSQENAVLSFINSTSSKLQWSVVENNNKYQTLYNYTWPNYAIWGSYDNEVMYMKTWLDNRLTWLETAFAGLSTATRKG